MINRYITAAILVTTLSCSHLANAVLIRVSDGDTVTNLASETGTIWDIDDDSGNLLGAFNVAVGTTMWDVVFQDGTFNEVYTSTATSDATTYEEAWAFSDALYSGVFVNGNAAKISFVYTGLIHGCGVGPLCRITTPYGQASENGWIGVNNLWLWADSTGFTDRYFYQGDDDTSVDSREVYARWTQVRIMEVPAPSPFSILALGLIGLASRRFKKQP